MSIDLQGLFCHEACSAAESKLCMQYMTTQNHEAVGLPTKMQGVTFSKKELRKTYLTIQKDFDELDPLALSKADRRAAMERGYKRDVLNDQEQLEQKLKWQAKQIKRLSNSASLYGPRESMREVWEYVRDEQKRVELARRKPILDFACEANDDRASLENTKEAIMSRDASVTSVCMNTKRSMKSRIAKLLFGSRTQSHHDRQSIIEGIVSKADKKRPGYTA